MSGHSRWAGIKHKKAAVDAKRGKVFTKIIREITIAAKIGGGSTESNARLRKAIDDAKAANMPLDNVKKAVQRGTGELPGVTYEEVSYEGYGPSGVAVLLSGTTDNRNRTSSEVRKIFTEHGGSLGESGCVAWMFHPKGVITVEKKAFSDEEKLMTLAVDAGGEDFKSDDPEAFEIVTPPAEFEKVKAALEGAKVALASAELTMVPQTTVPVEGAAADRVGSLLEALEENDDVANVHTNAEFKGA